MTVGVPQIQSEVQCRADESSARLATTARGRLHLSLGLESPDEDGGAPDQFIDESRRQRGQQTQRDVYT